MLHVSYRCEATGSETQGRYQAVNSKHRLYNAITGNRSRALITVATFVLIINVLLTAFFLFASSIKILGWQKNIFQTQLEFLFK